MQLDEVSSRAEFAAALTALREGRRLSVRELARRLGVPHSTLGEWFSGRHLPGPSQLELFERLLSACEVTGAAQWHAALQRVRSAPDRRFARAAVPYPGSRPFEPADAALFFGRADETAQLLDRVEALRQAPHAAVRTLVLVGPSGSGKSSLLRAGVITALRARGLSTALTTPEPGAVEQLAACPDVLVIDHFEQAFTLLAPAERSALLAALAAVAAPTVVLIALRSDYYPLAAGEPALGPALENGRIVLDPLGRDQLRAAITGPAARTDLPVEDGLVELILADLAPRGRPGLAHDPGALPLLAQTLLATWQRARGPRLGIGAYRAAGGIEAAVQRSAAHALAALSIDDERLARRLFVRLTYLGPDGTIARRRVGRAELAQLGAGAHELAGRFVAARLLTADEDGVQVTHEAVLACDRVRQWIDEDREGLRLHRRLTDAAHAWADAGRDPALLLRGSRLVAAADRAAQGELTPLEAAYVAASASLAGAEVAADRRRARGLRALAGTAAALAVLAGTSTAFALRSDAAADHSTHQLAPGVPAGVRYGNER